MFLFRKFLGIPKNNIFNLQTIYWDIEKQSQKPESRPRHMEEDDLVNMYRAEAEKSIKQESEQRINSTIPMKERIRLRSNSLKKLITEDPKHEDLIPSLLERLGPVRSALDGHGGGIVINNITFENFKFEDEMYIGIRPEDISLKKDREIQLNVKIDLIENLGFEKIIYSTASNKEINVKTSDNVSGKTLKISFSKDKIYLFDKSRNRIR